MPIQKLNERNGNALVLAEGEKVELEQSDVKLFFDDDLKGEGTLFFTTERVAWLCASDETGFAFDYPTFIIHAISRSPESFKYPCIYCQLQSSADEDESEDIPEVRFCPKEEAQLEEMFKVFSDMSALHPDPNDSEADECGDLMDPNHQWITADNVGDFEYLKEYVPDATDDAMEDASEEEEEQAEN